MGQYIRMILDILTHIFLAIISISYAFGEAKFGEENNVANDTKAIRKQKQFSLFTIVTFPNDECAAQSGSTTGAYYGTCLSSSECSANSGSVDGNLLQALECVVPTGLNHVVHQLQKIVHISKIQVIQALTLLLQQHHVHIQ